MCGIAGIVGIDNREQNLVVRMTASLAHRGPDSDGFYRNSIASVGARRLSIIDLDHGEQPITNEDETLAIVFNGEIYNYIELRNYLVGRGHRLKTLTDTEVVLHLYEEFGPKCLERLQGMFAFAIVSSTHVFLARDRFGIKPLFWARHPSRDLILFASEIKALLQCHELSISLDQEYMADRFILGHGTTDQTAFREIRALRPGHSVLIRPGGDELQLTFDCYFVPNIARESGADLADAISSVRQALERAVMRHLQADVAAGLTLSGGLDSTLLAYVMCRQSGWTGQSFTVACDSQTSDLLTAQHVASALGSKQIQATPSFDEYLSAIPKYLLAIETFGGLYALPFFMLCKRISKAVKLCLNGEGADELFGGYAHYLQQRPRLLELHGKLTAARRLGLTTSDRIKEITAVLNKGRSISTYPEYLHALLSIYQQDQLDHNHLLIIDHCSMAFGVEIRLPFLDDNLAALVNALPLSFKVNRRLSTTKYILKRVALTYQDDLLYDAVLRLKDGLPSAGTNYHRQFEQLCDTAIPDEYARNHEFGPLFCKQTPEGNLRGKWDLMLFDAFCQIFVSRRGVLPAGSVLQEILLSTTRSNNADRLKNLFEHNIWPPPSRDSAGAAVLEQTSLYR